MTTITQVQLTAPSQLGAADAAVYTSVTLSTAVIRRAVFCNTTASPTTITAGITAGGALGAATTLISARTLAPGESYVAPELAGAVIPPGGTLRAFAGVVTAVTFTASGLIVQ